MKPGEKMVIENIATGERIERWPVDVRELVASGEFRVVTATIELPTHVVRDAEGNALTAVDQVGADAQSLTSNNKGALPTTKELEAHLASLTSVDAIKELQARDTRVTAAPMYEARLAALATP